MGSIAVRTGPSDDDPGFFESYSEASPWGFRLVLTSAIIAGFAAAAIGISNDFARRSPTVDVPIEVETAAESLSQIWIGTGAGRLGNQQDDGRAWASSAAREIARKMRDYPAEYNRPGVLWLGGDPTPVQLVIRTNGKQDTASLFRGFEGDVIPAQVPLANDVSADLSGPPEMVKITLRGDKMRTVASPEPIAWVWDVQPLRPGKVPVTLEVISYVKIGTNKEPVPIRVLQDTWVVDARGIEWVKYQIGQLEPIRAFLFAFAAAIVAVLAWFGIKGFSRKPDFES